MKEQKIQDENSFRKKNKSQQLRKVNGKKWKAENEKLLY